MNPSTTFKKLNELSHVLPSLIYWLDLNQRYLGVNENVLKATGTLSYEKNFADKTPFYLFSTDIASSIIEHHQAVLSQKATITTKELIENVTTGEVKQLSTVIAPVYDDEGTVIGTIANAIDMTQTSLKAKRPPILEHLEMITRFIPVNVYWLDINNVVLGVNQQTLDAIGASSHDEIIGKTVYDLYPEKMAERIAQHHTMTIQQKKTLRQEEVVKDVKTGQIKHFTTVKTPLLDDYGNIIGTIGISIEITAEKEAENLKIINATQQAQLDSEEKFRRIVSQAVHDIRTPLATLEMLLKLWYDSIPEKGRIAGRDAVDTILAIVNNLLEIYRNQIDHASLEAQSETREPILLSALLLQLLVDKKYQYKDSQVVFDYDFNPNSTFLFINVEPISFKRMMSNLINNAVDACESMQGHVTLTLDATKNSIKVSVIDDGKGMPPEVVDKILNNHSITQGKTNGHGIGMTQVQDTLKRNDGKMVISSVEGDGTIVTLEFPRADSPAWITGAIKLKPDSIVVILDDDHSIHKAWDLRFEPILQQSPTLKIHHFKNSTNTISFIKNLGREEKQRVFLLTDYELLKQDINGLDVIDKTNVENSLLVTSHYGSPEIQEKATEVGTRILPKPLASDVPIIIEGLPEAKSISQVEMVLIDDNAYFIEMLREVYLDDYNVDLYDNPNKFIERISHYSKNIPIVLDNQFPDISGLDIAIQLNELGFTRLYILTGDVFLAGRDIPEYLTIIDKFDASKIKDLL